MRGLLALVAVVGAVAAWLWLSAGAPATFAVVAEETDSIGRALVVDDFERGYRILVMGRSVAGGIWHVDNSSIFSYVHVAAAALAQLPAGTSAMGPPLVIGVGIDAVARELGWTGHTAVDVSAAALSLGGTYFGRPQWGHAVVQDGRAFLEQQQQDRTGPAPRVVVMDVFLGGRHAAHLFTREALAQLRWDQALLLNLVALPSSPFPRRLAASLRALHPSLPLRLTADTSPPFTRPPNLLFFLGADVQRLQLPHELTLPAEDDDGKPYLPFDDEHLEEIGRMQDDIAASFDETFRSLVPAEIERRL